MTRETLKEILDLALTITESNSIYNVDVEYKLDIKAIYVTIKEKEIVTGYEHRYFCDDFKGSSLGDINSLKKKLIDLLDKINNNGGYEYE